MKTILADYRIFVPVTPEMEALRACPECNGKYSPAPDCEYLNRSFLYKNGKRKPACEAIMVPEDSPCGSCPPVCVCPTCKGTDLNPDQKPWWDVLGHIDHKTPLFMAFHKNNVPITIFMEFPDPIGKGYYNWGRTTTTIHRPENDNRPWAEVLRDLIDTYEDSTKAHSLSDTVSFALATHESAPVFKSFGIQTLVEV